MQVGNKKNKLTLLEKLPRKSPSNHRYGLFKCDCGNLKEIIISDVWRNSPKDWAIELRIKYGTLRSRYQKKWDVKKY